MPDKVVFTELVDILRPKRKVPKSDYLNAGALPIVDQGDGLIGGYTDDSKDRFPSTDPVVVFGDHTCRFKYVPFPFAAGADGTQVFRGREGIDTRYLYYACQTLGLEHYGYQRHMKHLKAAQVPTWPLAIQKCIVATLSAYDDLIENNTRRIAILEEMARRLYEEWFVYFRFPGYEEVSFKETDIGEIPADWEITRLGNACSRIQSGGTPLRSKAEYWSEGTVDWYKTKELWDGCLFDSEERVTEAAIRDKKTRTFRPGTILMAIYGSPTVGRLGITTQVSACNQAALGLEPDERKITKWYLFYTLWSLRDAFNSKAQGAAQQNISKQKVAETAVASPPLELQQSFESLVRPFRDMLQNLQEKDRNLRRQRDLLLPKLVSGEIDVSDMPLSEESSFKAA